MKHEDLSAEARLTRLLEEDPGRFEPGTAYRIAQKLGGADDLELSPHMDSRPAPLAVSHFRQSAGKTSLRTSFAALAGALGSLPPAYTELILRETRNRSHSLSRFIGLFASRFADLFAAAGEKYRIARRLRWESGPNSFRKAILSLCGFGTANLVETSSLKEDDLLRYAGFFANRTRNLVNLEAMLADFTALPVEVLPFQPRWITIPEQERSQMSGSAAPRLGINTVAGTASLNRCGGFRVVLGPLGYEDYVSLTTGSKRMTEILALTRLFAGAGFSFDFQILLKKEEVPQCRLDGGSGAVRLGWNTWARVAPAARDSGEAIIRETLESVQAHPEAQP